MSVFEITMTVFSNNDYFDKLDLSHRSGGFFYLQGDSMDRATQILKAFQILEDLRVRFGGIQAALELANFKFLDEDKTDPERIIKRYIAKSETKGKVLVLAFEVDPALGCSNYECREEFVEDADLFRQ